MHEQHQHCHHAFNICEQCDVVYCTVCNREWRGHIVQSPLSALPGLPTITPFVYTPAWGTTTIASDSSGIDSVELNSWSADMVAHSHN